ncbi:hypothetical protein [Paenibacillus abyssi]|uniref:Uncharacterized protein n=1 Tax=Paenibacillus abyssi TaxID=1340531 RepID=A0A917G1X8_9BACL|nr:hypothetical protein [Paenibacillus abyssi]GGG18161.1 hypothetical protein GCM10010916_38710 [Paenibacillus abyssi]
MASFVYWFIGVMSVGAVLALVNVIFTPRSDAKFGKFLSYEEFLEARPTLFIPAIPQHILVEQEEKRHEEMLEAITAIAPQEIKNEFSVSDIPAEMEGSISELFTALSGSADPISKPMDSVMQEPAEADEVPEWVMQAELAAMDEEQPSLTGIVVEDPVLLQIPSIETAPAVIPFDLVGLEPPDMPDYSIPEDYAFVSAEMDLIPSLSGAVAPYSEKQTKGNVIPFPGLEMDEHIFPEQAPYHIPFSDYQYIRKLYGTLADRVTTTPALGPKMAEDVLVGKIAIEASVTYLEFRGSRIPISGNAKSFLGEMVFVSGYFVSEHKFFVCKIQLAQEAAKAQEAV